MLRSNFEHFQQQTEAGRSLVNFFPEDKKDQTVSNFTNVSKNVIFVVISPFRNLSKKSYSHYKIIMSDTLTAQPYKFDCSPSNNLQVRNLLIKFWSLTLIGESWKGNLKRGTVTERVFR